MNEIKQDVEHLLKEGNTVQFPIRGWSMYPFLSDQDIVTVTPIENHVLKINDVVLYRRINGPLVLHRIIKMDQKGYYLCGDNQTAVEGPLSVSQIIGVLSEYTHNGKTVNTSSISYRVATNTWRLIRPARPVFSKTVHALKSVIKR